MSELIVKISNGQRMRKVENYTKDIRNRRNRPHAYYKCFTYLQIPKMMEKFGYKYTSQSKLLQEIQSSFESKCEVYFNKTRRVKLGRMDKIRLKQQLDFQLKENPILSFFNKIDKKLVRPNLTLAFEKITNFDNRTISY